jgi:hypothetical protein
MFYTSVVVLFPSPQYFEPDHVSARVTLGGDIGSDERLIVFTTFPVDVQDRDFLTLAAGRQCILLFLVS